MLPWSLPPPRQPAKIIDLEHHDEAGPPLPPIARSGGSHHGELPLKPADAANQQKWSDPGLKEKVPYNRGQTTFAGQHNATQCVKLRQKWSDPGFKAKVV
jgi:hypothetical protein